MKYWRSKLARLNDKINNYIKQHYNVVDYEVKVPSQKDYRYNMETLQIFKED